jgi:O-antigen ligase
MTSNYLNFIISRNTLLGVFLLQPLFLFWYKGYFLLTLLGLSLVFFVDLTMRHGRIWFDFSPLPVYIFFLLPLVSVLWSRYPDETLWRGGLVLVNIGIFYLMMRANSFNPHAVISRLVVIVPIVMAVMFVFIYVKFGSIRPDSREMGEVVKSICNGGPAMVVLCVPYLLLPGIIVNKWASWGALAACLLVVVLSESRGGVLMLALVIPLTALFYPASLSTRILRLVKLTGVLAAVFVTIALVVGVDRFVNPVLDRFMDSQLFKVGNWSDPSREEGDFGRLLLLTEGVNAVREEPFRGIGYGGFKNYIEDRHGKGHISHNLFITAWSEMGLLGMFVLCWLLWAVFFGLSKYSRGGGCFDSQKNKMIAVATFVALLLAIIHAQLRPVFSNPMLTVLLAQAYTMMRLRRNYQRSFAEHRRVSLFPSVKDTSALS